MFRAARGLAVVLGLVVAAGNLAAEDDAVDFYSRAREKFLAKEFDQAIDLFTDSIRVNPEFAEAYMFRGNTWYVKENFDKAIKDYTEGLMQAATNHRTREQK